MLRCKQQEQHGCHVDKVAEVDEEEDLQQQEQEQEQWDNGVMS